MIFHYLWLKPQGRSDRQEDFVLIHFVMVGGEKFLAPIKGCLFFLKDCNEVPEVSFLRPSPQTAVKPVSAVTAMLFPFSEVPGALDAWLITFLSIMKSAESCGSRGSETEPADKASLYIFTPLFLGSADDTLRRVNAHKPCWVVQSL
jgi:hypothetical protein